MRTENIGWGQRLSFYSWEIANTDVRALSRKVARWADVDSESGVTAIEYGLLAALVAVVIIGGATALGNKLSAVFTGVSSAMTVPNP